MHESSTRTWLKEIHRALLLVTIFLVVGWLLKHPIVGLALGCAIVTLYWGYHLRLIQDWLENPEAIPPKTIGLWGLILSDIQSLQRRNREVQSRLKSALDYLQEALASMRDASIIVDNHGNIAWANDSANFLLGIHFPSDRGQPLLNLIRFSQFQQYFEAEDYSSPLRIVPIGESGRCLQFEISHFGVGDRLIFVHDVTETFKLEQIRRDFVGNVSHELRTPLTVIKGYIDTLQGVKAFENPKFQRPLEQMNEQADRMENLLRDLLWLSRIETLETQRKSELVDIAKLVQESTNELRTGYAERTIELALKCDRSVFGDRLELHSAFSNLIVNALKYSNDVVNVHWFERDGQGIFAVRDRGAGIAPQHIPRLTERFYRIDKSRSQRIGGTGLGLAIVKHVATAHQAELKIDSTVGEGCTFSLVFPLVNPKVVAK